MDFSYFKSRTFWTIIIIFVVNGGNAVIPMIPPGWQATATGLLGMLAMYFHVNPSQEYKTGSVRRRY